MASIPRKPVAARPTVNPSLSDEGSQDLNPLQEDDDPKDDMIQELLLREISSKLGTIAETSIHELRLLHSLSDRISLLEASKVEFIWNAVLQTIGIIFVIIFGVFAVLAYNANEIANRQSFESNQLSLLGYCNQAQYPQNGICAAISQQAAAPLTSLATAVMGTSIQLTPTTSPTTSETAAPSTNGLTSSAAPTSSAAASSSLLESPSSSSVSPTLSATSSATPSSVGSGASPHSSQHLSNPVIAGIVVGVFSIILSIGASWFGFRAKFQRRPDGAVSAASYDYLPVGRGEA